MSRADLDGLGSLIELLSPVAAGPDRYLAPSRFGASSGRLFGGQLVAQALRAATLSVDAAYLPHSLHSYFVSTGHASRPVDLRVERVRTGRPVSNSGARGLVLGTAYSIGGELLASTAQEVVIRSGAVR